MKQHIIPVIYATIMAIAFSGLAYAMDQRIDNRVAVAIDEFKVQDIEQKIEFYIIKKEMTGLSGEDRINKQILERQLDSIREK